VPLDVNVEVPQSVSSNTIYNEPIQDLDWETYWLYNSNVTNATRLTKVANRQPLATDSWDFSDGAYRALATQITNRTPAFVAFGGLQTNNISNRVNIARLRQILVGAFEYPSISDLRVLVDKLVGTPTWHLFNASVVSSGEPKYFSFTATASTAPGVNQEAVVELVYLFNAATTANSNLNTPVDISPSLDTHTIADGCFVPLYGYNLLAKTKSFSFPNIVRFVGNRLVLSGNTNLVLVSASDWNYRGFTFTNCQVSSLNFSGSSPYLLQLEQAGGNVRAIESVNGVMVVSSDSATYRVSGKERNAPPTADTAVISRITNQTAAATCLVVAENAVYMANERGLYKLNYVREQDEGVLEDLSLPVSSIFGETPSALVYSRTLDSLLVSFPSQRKLLTFSLLTKTYSQTHVSVPYPLQLFSTLDGYVFGTSTAQVVATWNSRETADLVNVNFLSLFTLAANTLSVTTAPVSAETLSVSPHLASPLAVPAYNGSLRAVGGAFVLTETPAGNTSKAVVSCATTKAIYTDKFSRGLRLRDLTVLLSGSGTAQVVAADAGLENANQSPPVYSLSVDNFGRAAVTGEQNKASANLAFPSGDTVQIRLGNFGLSEAYAVGFRLSPALEIVGFALNTSARSLQRSSV
jgi:hypothetical protein